MQMRKPETIEPDPWHFPRPELAEAYLKAFDLKLSSARGLFARRRMGKTEFLRRDLLPAAAAAGYLIAYTNLWDNRSAPDIALVAALTDALEPQGVKAVLTKLGQPLKKIRASAKIPGGAEGALEAETNRKRCAKCSSNSTARKGRSCWSSTKHRCWRVPSTATSRMRCVLRSMFARASEPFYNWAPLEAFPLLGDDFVAFTIELMNSMARHVLTLEQGKRAFDELHRTPEFFKRFVERYMLYQPQGEEAALAHTKASVFSDQHFLKQWNEMNPADQAVITMLARGNSELHAKEGMAKLSVMLGKPATKNTAGHALRRLQSDNVVTRLALGDYRIEDEAFAEWIRRRTAPKH
jgi:hypothetical protein